VPKLIDRGDGVMTDDFGNAIGFYHAADLADTYAERVASAQPGDAIAGDDVAKVRTFGTGATRSNDKGRIDPEGFLSPLAVERYCEYLDKHRYQADGTIRDSDNWQRGIPLASYAKSLWRHVLAFWTRHRGFTIADTRTGVDIEEDLCAIIFNAQGYLHELLKDKRRATTDIG